ncbi:hypothetical protein IHE44_0013199 [Lamprotornis superbus]|uniref:Integrator complex subunit 10 n=1 Tax=Lamprotornis superbus TaxID=245042 RepID=A0A835NR03_9PASS|nr:hypothetical protein IHE44_0013199 [Lamprotornis superbus]
MLFVNFPDQPAIWREISVITSALRNDSQDKQTQFLRGLFETLPGRVQCEMLLKATEQCFNTLERAEMLLLLLRRFPETVVQHGFFDSEIPKWCFNYLVMMLMILQRMRGSQDSSDIMSPSKRSSQKYVIDGLTEKSSQITDPWERLFKILSVVGMRCEWQMDKGRRSYSDILNRMKDLCRYISNFDSEAHIKYKNQVVYSTMLVFFKNAFQYVSNIQPSLFQGPNAPNQTPLVLLEDVPNIYGDTDIDRNKHIHKKRKLAEGREKTMRWSKFPSLAQIEFWLAASSQTSGVKRPEYVERHKSIVYSMKASNIAYTMSSDDEDPSGKARSRHITVNKADLANSIEVLESFKLARESWELLCSLESLDKDIDMLEEFAYLRTQEGGKIHLELLPNQAMLIKHHTVTRGITKGVKEDFRLAMERQVSRCGENLMHYTQALVAWWDKRQELIQALRKKRVNGAH